MTATSTHHGQIAQATKPLLEHAHAEPVVTDLVGQLGAGMRDGRRRETVPTKSIPANSPADEITSPSSTNRSSGRTSIVGSSSVNVSSEAQCVVAGRPRSSPAAAYTNEPVHSLVISGTRSLSSLPGEVRLIDHEGPGA